MTASSRIQSRRSNTVVLSRPGQLVDRAWGPRALPAAEVQQPVEQSRRESPYEHPPHLERWTYPSRGVTHTLTTGRVRKFRDGHPNDGRHLLYIDRFHRMRLAPPGQHRGDDETAHRNEQLRQLGDDLHRHGVDPGLFLGLTKRRSDRAVVLGVDRAAGERRLARVRAQRRRALDEEHIW